MTFHNPASTRMHGIEREGDGLFQPEEIPVQWRAWDSEGVPVPFEDWPIARVLKGERFEDRHFHVERADGGVTFDAVYSGAPIYGASTEFLLGFITLRDVQKEIDAQRALAATHDLLRGFTDAVPGVIYAKDAIAACCLQTMGQPI